MEAGKTTPVRRSLSIIETLVRHTFEGMTAAELAAKLGCPRSNVYRDLDALMDAGWVEAIAGDRYSITPRFAGLLKAYNLNMSDTQSRIDQFQHRAETAARQILRNDSEDKI